MNFRSLYQSCYHKVATGPFEANVKSLVGSDIVLHLPVLEYYASLCGHVVEFGVRTGESTVALLAGSKGVLHSFDIVRPPIVDILYRTKLPSKWEFTQLSTVSAEEAGLVPETDMLFVDTLHTYRHVTKELSLHGRKARRYLAFHDTFTCGERDVSGASPNETGILPAINEFLARFDGEYRTVYRTDCCNGLWVLERL